MKTNAIKKVLVVDDDPVVAKSFHRILSGKGYAVIHAADGAEALDKLAREDYDVVYTDLRMPGMHGLEVAQRIRETRPWLPVVIVTGYADERNEAAAQALGVTAFLHKPLAPQAIAESADFAIGMTAAAPAAAPAPATPHGVAHFAKNVALFFGAPLVALAYIVVGPLVGLGMLGWFGYRALVTRTPEDDAD